MRPLAMQINLQDGSIHDYPGDKRVVAYACYEKKTKLGGIRSLNLVRQPNTQFVRDPLCDPWQEPLLLFVLKLPFLPCPVILQKRKPSPCVEKFVHRIESGRLSRHARPA